MPKAPEPVKKKAPPKSQPAPATKAAAASSQSQQGSPHNQTELDRWKVQVQRHMARHLQRKRFATKNSELTLKMSLNTAGQLQDIAIVRSSGNPDLDTEVLAHAKRISPFPRPPAGAGLVLTQPVSIERR